MEQKHLNEGTAFVDICTLVSLARTLKSTCTYLSLISAITALMSMVVNLVFMLARDSLRFKQEKWPMNRNIHISLTSVAKR